MLGSGALQIGQAGEFDYSGTQALKALRQEGVATVLVNPNIATVQTDEGLADRVYLTAVTPEMVAPIIERESVDSVLLGFGGQTALNCGLALDELGVFARHGVRVLGTPLDCIRDTEDRERFKRRLAEINVPTPRSFACGDIPAARTAVERIGLPVMLRGAFALGGKGSAVVRRREELDAALKRAFAGGVPQVLVEEYLGGWKEIEVEVVRDSRDNCIAVCAMENVDPMGIHTGESIVVAPTQTLNDQEAQTIRSVALRVIRHFGVIGECNVQFALNPSSVDYRVIEVNARLSRSSALASKATGYPLAYIAAKLALGYALPEIPNAVTGSTTAFFEPALDYIVCKFPRWDLAKFRGASERIGSEMKSVGEAMAIGRSFPEALQKAIRMLDVGVHGLDPEFVGADEVSDLLQNPTPDRIFAVARALHEGRDVDEVSRASGMDPWFLHQIQDVVAYRSVIASRDDLSRDELMQAKLLGFSDRQIAELQGVTEHDVRVARERVGVCAKFARIDTLAGEFPAETNYAYRSFQATEEELPVSQRKKIMVLGSGPYRIGSSVEFDWCCVSAVQAAEELGYETVMLNCNPETVSTDYDVCDRLVFDEVSLESILDLYERERPVGVVVSMGGQVPNNLVMQLHSAGVRVLGTAPESIDMAEDRHKFSGLLDRLGIDQPRWTHLTEARPAGMAAAVERVGGFPVLVRPSYVLSGAAMSVAREPNELARILQRALAVSPAHPVVITAFETHAREIEVDAVADDGEIVCWAICEHVEDAGVHSGDAVLMLPPQTIPLPVIHNTRSVCERLAKALKITGPFNVQLLARRGVLRVIELNLRASRSLPFVSKVTGTNFVREAVRRMLGVRERVASRVLEMDYVGAKVPQFSFPRIVGADPMLGVEMASTGEVGCLGDNANEAMLHALLATGFRVPTRGVLLSLGPLEDKYSFTDEARALAEELGLEIFATEGTAEMLASVGVKCTALAKTPGHARSAMEVIEAGMVELVINVPRSYDELGRPDGYMIRRGAVDASIPLITDLSLARAVVDALLWLASGGELKPRPWDEFVFRSTGANEPGDRPGHMRGPHGRSRRQVR